MTARLDAPSDAAKMRVMRRDRYACAYCGIEGKDAELQIDHIVPVVKGGSHHIANLVTSCRSCNQSKGASDSFATTGKKGSQIMSNGFNGLFIHTLKNGRIENQGQIIRKDGDLYAVQLFSFFDGRPTIVRFLSQDQLVSGCNCYAVESEWVAAHAAEMESIKRSGGCE